MNNCPIEMASVTVKMFVDILIQIGMCNSIDDVPESITQLLLMCNKKSDQQVETEILNNYLKETKAMIDT